MGTANNSIAKIQDVIDEGGVRTTLDLGTDNTKLLKDNEISGQTPAFYNVTLKKRYGDKHLVKFQDLDIAETYPIKLKVDTTATTYTLYGFTTSIKYPNEAYKVQNINIKVPSTTKYITLNDCCNGARIFVSIDTDSGATVGVSPATVQIVNGFNSSGVVCTGETTYNCFVLSATSISVNPTGDTSTTRDITIYISTYSFPVSTLEITTASYGTGSTLSEVQALTGPQVIISSLCGTFTGLTTSTMAIQHTISVPSNAYVVLFLSNPKGSTGGGLFTQYSWTEGNYQYINPGTGATSVTYTVNGFAS